MNGARTAILKEVQVKNIPEKPWVIRRIPDELRLGSWQTKDCGQTQPSDLFGTTHELTMMFTFKNDYF